MAVFTSFSSPGTKCDYWLEMRIDWRPFLLFMEVGSCGGRSQFLLNKVCVLDEFFFSSSKLLCSD